MGMSSRSRTEIAIQILEAANGGSGSSSGSDDGSTKSEIMYKAFISHGQLEEYLMVLTESDLLRYDFLRHTFKTTEKGLRFLKTYNQMDKIMKVPQI
jgi:predicted transcriptional regulator